MGYKNKKFRRVAPYKIFVVIVLAAIAVLLLGMLIARMNGIQNTTVTLENGEELKYVGFVDRDGNPTSGTLYFSNGIQMVLDVKKGTATYSDGTVYAGGFDGNYLREGYGKITWANGDSYEGDFVAGELTGRGIFYFAGGDVYEGDLVGGVKEGYGKYTSADGSTYEGEFKGDLRHGKGIHTAADGSVYEGDFVDGIKEGYGKYVYATGDVYEGEFKGDLRHGKGKYVWANGETYTGDFANGNMNGYGTYTWPTGRPSYTGYFENGVIVVVKPR